MSIDDKFYISWLFLPRCMTAENVMCVMSEK